MTVRQLRYEGADANDSRPTFRYYVAILSRHEIPPAHFEHYKKWLRYFYDFNTKNLNSDDKPEKVRQFLEKLRSKKQMPVQCQQAAHAVSLYFEMQSMESQQVASVNEPEKENNQIVKKMSLSSLSPDYSAASAYIPAFKQRQSQYSVAGYEEKSDSPEWDVLMAVLAGEIKVRHYSRNTLKTYAHWSRQFQRFLKNKPPQELSTDDVKEYLTYLAVKCKVAATTQNQAFNSLLFLFRHALKREFGVLQRRATGKKVALHSDGALDV